METVEDADGARYVLCKRSRDAWLVRDPATGEETYRDPAELTVVDGAAPLATAAAGVPEQVRRVIRAVPNDRALGLVVTVVDDGPIGVRELLGETTLCESDLHGLLGELVAAELLAETSVGGERGYEPTEAARRAVEHLRE